LIISIPTRDSYEVHDLAQDKNSVFGKIVEINKNDLDKIIANEENNLDVKIFTMGHRTAQGLTKINESFFSVEHGPKGGDELNKIIKGKNYGWPKVSYGTKYMWNEKGKSFEISHENNEFEEPLFALVPSVGISAVNSCPKKLKT
jgi:glucose/arabinose dehydrogenase